MRRRGGSGFGGRGRRGGGCGSRRGCRRTLRRRLFVCFKLNGERFSKAAFTRSTHRDKASKRVARCATRSASYRRIVVVRAEPRKVARKHSYRRLVVLLAAVEFDKLVWLHPTGRSNGEESETPRQAFHLGRSAMIYIAARGAFHEEHYPPSLITANIL